MATIDYIAKVYAAYEKHAGKGATRRTRSPSYEPSTNRTERLDETFEQESDALIAKAEFAQLQSLIPDFLREARDAIERICVDDEAIPTAWIADLCMLLTMIEEVRNGERPAAKLSRGNLPPHKSLGKRTSKAPPRQERFEKGVYAAATKSLKPSELTGEAAEAAARDREGLERMLLAGNDKRGAGEPAA
jgi:hypothetical protein